MAVLRYQNPNTVDAILDSLLISAGPPEVRREILVIGDGTGANVTLVSGRVPVDGSGVTQPISGAISFTAPQHVIVDSGSTVVTQATAANLNATVVFASTQHVIVDSATLGTVAVDVTDRIARLLGSVRIQDGSGTSLTSTGAALDVNLKTSSITLPVSIAAAIDVSDRAARLLGVVYGSQGQQLKQTATNFNSQVELAAGATLYDARQIRALTSADVVTAVQGTAAALASAWPVEITDGTNVLGTSAHPVRVDPTGTTTQPVSLASTTVTNTVAENLTQWASTVLGVPTNFGTTPGAVIAGSVNASLFSGTTGLTNTGSALDVNIKTSSINIGVTQQTSPWVDNLTQVAGVVLGATAVVNYGSTPAAVAVPGVNAFITNTVAVSGTVSVTNFANPLPVSQSGLWNVNQAIGVAGFGKITDGVNTAAVKAASTATIATDPSLVVAFSPNSPLPVGTNVIGALVANQSVSLTQTVGTSFGTAVVNYGLSQLVDEKGNFVQFSEHQNLSQAIYMELKAIRKGIQSLAADVDSDLMELAQEDEDQPF